MRFMATGALLAHRFVDVRGGLDLPLQILVAAITVFRFGPAAQQEAIVRLVGLVTDRAVGFGEDGVRVAFPRYSVAPCAGLLDRTALEQEFGVSGVRPVATGAGPG